MLSDRWRERVKAALGPHDHGGDTRITCSTWIYGAPASSCNCSHRDRIPAIRALIEEVEGEALEKVVRLAGNHFAVDLDARERFQADVRALAQSKEKTDGE